MRERINDNEDEPDSLLTINPYSNLYATNDATNAARQIKNHKIQILILLFSLSHFTCDKLNNKILFNFINLPIAKAYNQTYFFFIKHLKETK